MSQALEHDHQGHSHSHGHSCSCGHHHGDKKITFVSGKGQLLLGVLVAAAIVLAFFFR